MNEIYDSPKRPCINWIRHVDKNKKISIAGVSLYIIQ